MKCITTHDPLHEAARIINDLLTEHAHDDVLLLCSGGSALAVVDHVDTSLFSPRTTISVIDERYTNDPLVSNFSQLTRTAFFERASRDHAHSIDPRPEPGESLDEAARRFDLALKEWHVLHRDGICIAILGVGTDGHTAGILPYPHQAEAFSKLFSHPKRCVVGYAVNPGVHAYTHRMTATCTYLVRHVSHAVVYATGNEKHAALEALTARSGSCHETPARIMHDMRDVRLVTDQTVLHTP